MRQRKTFQPWLESEPTTSRFDQLLLYQLHRKARWEQVVRDY